MPSQSLDSPAQACHQHKCAICQQPSPKEGVNTIKCRICKNWYRKCLQDHHRYKQMHPDFRSQKMDRKKQETPKQSPDKTEPNQESGQPKRSTTQWRMDPKTDFVSRMSSHEQLHFTPHMCPVLTKSTLRVCRQVKRAYWINHILLFKMIHPTEANASYIHV